MKTIRMSAQAMQSRIARYQELKPLPIQQSDIPLAARDVVYSRQLLSVIGLDGAQTPINAEAPIRGAAGMTMTLAVARAAREAWPAEKPLFVRVSSIDDVEGGWSLDDTVAFARELKVIGVDVVDCSSGGIQGSATAAAKTMVARVPGFQLPFAEYVRKEAGIKTMAVGLIITPLQAEEALAAGRADLIAIGREALYDPNWPLHAAQSLGADPEMQRWPLQYGWWLVRREGLLRKLGLRK